jgi:hypothetical protein
MRNHSKLVLAGLGAALLMALAVSSASANRLSTSSGNFRSTWTSLEFASSEEGGFGTVRCRVTLEGTFHSRTISKVEKALIANITRASVAAPTCTGGNATILQETLPWNVRYNGFKTRLPEIKTVRLLLIDASFRINIRALFEFNCLTRTKLEHPADGEVILEPTTGTVINLQPDPNLSIPTTSAGGAGCPSANGHFLAGATDGNTTVLGAATRITIKLI